jgi:hypothetical protein
MRRRQQNETSDSCDPLATGSRNQRSLSSQRNINGGKSRRGRDGRNIYRCHIINQYGQAVIKPMLLRERWMAMWGVNIRHCFHSIEAHGQWPVYLEICALRSINKSINRQISLSHSYTNILHPIMWRIIAYQTVSQTSAAKLSRNGLLYVEWNSKALQDLRVETMYCMKTCIYIYYIIIYLTAIGF